MSINETDTSFERRTSPRLSTNLQTKVQIRESDNYKWEENTETTTVSRNGAGFTLSRECVVGRLVKLVMPMPRELRIYDQKKGLYPIMAVVQHCYKTTIDDHSIYHVGVAFIGKQIPESFKINPSQSYRIRGMKKNGLWQVIESERPFLPRKHTRFWRRFEVTVSLKHKDQRSIMKKNAFTRDVSAGGMSIWGSFEVDVGDRIKLICKQFEFYTLAVVRNRAVCEDDMPTLHLEFIENVFPVDKILISQKEPPIDPDGSNQIDSNYPEPTDPSYE